MPANLTDHTPAPEPGPVTFDTVMKAELEAIRNRRHHALHPDQPSQEASDPEPAQASAGEAGTPDNEEKALRVRALDEHLAGLALSGGGIRSATFALGVLQALAGMNLLRRFDYLSTVSGGGYAGGWLAAWIKRTGGVLPVEQQLSVSRVDQRKPDRAAIGRARIVDEEPEPVRHLREFSNFLTPRTGALTTDTWTLFAIYIRNTVINALLLIPLTMMVVLTVRLLAARFISGQEPESWQPVMIFWAALLWLIGGFVGIGGEIAKLYGARAENRPEADTKDAREVPRRVRPRSLWRFVITPLVVAFILLVWLCAPNPKHRSGLIFPVGITVFGVPVHTQTKQVNVAPRLPSFGLSNLFLRTRVAWGGDNTRLNEEKDNFSLVTALSYALVFGVLHAAAHGLGFLIAFRKVIRGKAYWNWSSRYVPKAALCLFVSGATGGFLIAVLAMEGLWKWADFPVAVVSFGPPLGILIFVGATFIDIWLLGRLQDEDVREWSSRLCALLMLLALFWVILFATIFYVPAWIDLSRDYWLGSGLATGWLATSVAGALAGRSPRTDNPQKGGNSRWLEWIGAIAPVVFLVGLLASVAVLVSALVDDPGRRAGLAGQSNYLTSYWAGIHGANPVLMVVWLVIAGLGAWLANSASDVNMFSLHSMYANRLTRCYLGASRPKMRWLLRTQPPRGADNEDEEDHDEQGGFRRQRVSLTTAAERRGDGQDTGQPAKPRVWLPGRGGAPTTVGGKPPLVDPDATPGGCDPLQSPCRSVDPRLIRQANLVTGFDPDDDIPLWEMKVGESEVEGAVKMAYWGPIHLINTSLNLVAGKELALQDRKAESFTLSALYCGSKSTWYRPVDKKTASHLTLGRAMAISGAAADPNMGRHQSAPLTALMTIFNARLGWWLQNPRFDGWVGSGPTNAKPLLHELFGLTDERHPFVHLSDGGHFENLGVYELIRRRCRYVVAVDAEQDGDMTFDGLATLIRQCRTDFGIRIEINPTPLKPEGPDRLSRWHGVVGRIRYDDVDGGEVPGLLIYLKASVTGDEPVDVRNYRATNPEFPHQTTADQSFDEAQFEAYRALGHHVANEVLRDGLDEVRDAEPLWPDQKHVGEFIRGNRRLFSAVERRWSSDALTGTKGFLAAGHSWVDVHKDLRTEQGLRELSRDLYPEVAPPGTSSRDGEPDGKLSELHGVAQMLQVMEDAWLDLHLARDGAHPVSRGWMGVFRRWSTSAAFRRHWPTLRPEFSQDFVRFCESQLGLKSDPKVASVHEVGEEFARETTDRMAGEILREWPADVKLERPQAIDLGTILGQAHITWTAAEVARARGQGVELRPPVWLILQAPVGEDPLASPHRFATGIIVAWRPDPQKEPLTFRVFLWIRPAYRSVGIGSHAARRTFPNFLGTVASATDAPPTAEVTIQVEYPPAGEKRAESSEFALWRNFYSLYDFRPAPRHSEFEPGDSVRIERRFRLNEFGMPYRPGPASSPSSGPDSLAPAPTK